MNTINTERGRRDPRSEHRAMLSCRCTEADRMSFVCVKCGAVHLWDPSWFFIGGFVALFAWNVWSWVTL